MFREGRSQYEKHLVIRRKHGLIDSDGTWVESVKLNAELAAAGGATVLKLNRGMCDILHVLWLLLESAGIDPRLVDQVWHLDQSICRSKRTN